MIFGINTTSDISILFYIISQAIRRVKFGAILKYHELNSVHVFLFVEFFRLVGKDIGFEVLVFGPGGPDIEPGRCTFLSILVFRIFF